MTRWRECALLLLLSGCSPEPIVELGGQTMGTTYTVKCEGGDAQALSDATRATLRAVNAVFSTYDPGSEISRFNAHRSTEPFAASPEFAALMRLALEVAERTDGAFDPTVFPVVDLHGFGPSGRAMQPSDEDVAAALGLVGYRAVEVRDDGHLVKSVPDLRLDLSAIAKGWGVDRVAAALEATGVASYMVEIGGEVRCAGVKAGGAPWTIGIEGPGAAGAIGVIDLVELRGESLATSGSYRNFIESGGRTMHHIVDPRTARNPDNGVISVSIRAPSCALADALATACMVLGPERAEAVLSRMPDEALAALFLVATESGPPSRRTLRW